MCNCVSGSRNSGGEGRRARLICSIFPRRGEGLGGSAISRAPPALLGENQSLIDFWRELGVIGGEEESVMISVA